jgi:chromodomain-helicase-DNA-binding protein 4
MSPLQRDLYRKILTKNFASLRNGTNGKFAQKTSLNNILVELRKLLNHPYLIQGGEPAHDGMDEQTKHKALIESCGKLHMIHAMLRKMKERGNRVLIFSTMTRTLDVLEVNIACFIYFRQ